MDDDNEEGEAAASPDSNPVFREFEFRADRAVGIPDLGGEPLGSAFDALRRGVSAQFDAGEGEISASEARSSRKTFTTWKRWVFLKTMSSKAQLVKRA